MSKHTPGPWRVEPVEDQEVLILTQEHGRIAECFWIGDSQGPRLDATLANARLIAAAPELLEALRYCVGRLQDIETLESAPLALKYLADARALIAKAEGKDGAA